MHPFRLLDLNDYTLVYELLIETFDFKIKVVECFSLLSNPI
jgi:hypothetical protein